jgi:hypothetical protein
MMARFSLNQFASSIAPRHVGVAVIMLCGLTLAGPPRLLADDCQQGVASISFDKGERTRTAIQLRPL